MNKTTAETIQTELAHACRSVLEEHGLEFDPGDIRVRYSTSNSDISFTGTAHGVDEPINAFDAASVGLADGVERDQEFEFFDKTYRLAGIKRSNRKYPILAVSEDDGKTYKLPRAAAAAINAAQSFDTATV